MSNKNGRVYRKILFINPPTDSELGSSRPSLGIGIVAEYLKQYGIEYKVIDMRLGYNMINVGKLIKNFKPDIIGLSIFSHGYKKTYKFIHNVRSLGSKFDIVTGGPHLSVIRNDVLSECKVIDFGVVMEGEETLLDLCQGKPPGEIPGLIHRQDGKVVFNGDRPFIKDLDSNPFPKYEEFELSKYISEIYIISTRGCPYLCIYCPNSSVIGKKMRYRYAKTIVQEIMYWYNKGYRQFNFVDDNFTIKKSRVYEICDEIEKEKLEGLFLRCTNGIRADAIDRELLIRMKSVGFKHVCFGVEGGNDRILTVLKKGESLAVIENAIKEACELEYDVALFFVVGAPSETWEDVMDSARIAEKYPILRVSFYNLLPFPKTELYEWVVKNGYLLYEPEDYLNRLEKYDIEPVFETPELSREKRIEAMKYLRKVEKRVTRRAVERKLQWLPVLNVLLAYCFASDQFQKMLFQNNTFRKIIEKIRYTIYTR